MKKYLEATDIIDYHDEAIQTLAKKLSLGVQSDEAIAKKCFEWVRDEIEHCGTTSVPLLPVKPQRY